MFGAKDIRNGASDFEQSGGRGPLKCCLDSKGLLSPQEFVDCEEERHPNILYQHYFQR